MAGGSTYLHQAPDIASDWLAVVNYVKNNAYDGTGLLQIGIRNASGGHAINFLRYENVGGQDRIYAYDNNFPSQEVYLYRDSQGRVCEAPQQTFQNAITCIALRDIRTYFPAWRAASQTLMKAAEPAFLSYFQWCRLGKLALGIQCIGQ